MSPAGRDSDPRTPIAWQHRDINYHSGNYGPGAEASHSPSARLDKMAGYSQNGSHHRDTTPQRDFSHREYPVRDYPPRDYPVRDYPTRDYPQSRDMSPSERHYNGSRQQDSGTATSTLSSSSSEDESEQPHQPMTAAYPGYPYHPGYYPGYPPHQPTMVPFNGTIKSAKSVPSILAPTVDGEPCPIHHHGPPPPMPVPPPMMYPGYATMGPPRRAASIYDMRQAVPTIYGTLPHHPHPHHPPHDSRSVAGSMPPAPGAPMGIPPHLLPPMARPRPPLVIGEGRAAPELLPVRGSKEKAAEAAGLKKEEKQRICCRGGGCVVGVIFGVIVAGVILALMLLFIL